MPEKYAPFRHGSERGKTGECPWCGKKPMNQHSLRESAECDKKHYGRDNQQEAA